MNVPHYFEELPDFRVKGRCLHELSDIVMLVLCGLIADCEDFEEIEDYGNDKEAYLQGFLKLPNGIPSHDTLNRPGRRCGLPSLGCIGFRNLPSKMGTHHSGPFRLRPLDG